GPSKANRVSRVNGTCVALPKFGYYEGVLLSSTLRRAWSPDAHVARFKRLHLEDVQRVHGKPRITPSVEVLALWNTESSAAAASIRAKWAPQTKTLARIVFGFLMFRLGMEQVLGFPGPSSTTWMSFEGMVRLLAFPSGLLLIAGLFTRPVALLLSVLS